VRGRIGLKGLQRHQVAIGEMGCGFLFVIVLLMAGCEKPTIENIETWKGTVKGPGRLESTVESSGVEPALRARAAIALTEIGKGDRVDALLQSMAADARAPLVTALIAAHGEVLKAGGDKTSSARDGLFGLRSYAGQGELETLDTLLVAAIGSQLKHSGQFSGSHSLAKIVEAVGARAAPVLLALLQTPSENPSEIAGLLAKVGDDKTRAAASDVLVKYVRGRATVSPGMWEALGTLGGPSATAFLQESVKANKDESAVRAAQALQLRPHPELGPFALAVANDPRVNGSVRDEMFGLAEACCGDSVVPGLGIVIGTTREDMVRYRAYEAAITAGGSKAIVPTLEAFPVKLTFKVEDVQDFLVKDIEKLAGRKGGKAPVIAALVAGLGSASPLCRMVALMALEKLGSGTESAAVKALEADKATLPGFSGGSVGEVARRVAGKLASP
jgi:hypothetical protein